MPRKLGSHIRHNAIAYVALFFALAGGAYAAATTAAANSVNSASIINGQVKTADLANGAVNASKVTSNSLTGGQINESSLGTVPRAGAAANASKLGGAPASSYTKAITLNGQLLGPTPTTILATHGLTLTANCTATAKPTILTLKAASSSGGRFEINAARTLISNGINGTPTLLEDNRILSAGGSSVQVFQDQFPNTNSGEIDAGGTFVSSAGNGSPAVTGTFHIYMQNGGGECDLLGNAVPSP
jgi:hypothetical protein